MATIILEEAEQYLKQADIKYLVYGEEELREIVGERLNDLEAKKEYRKYFFEKYGKKDPREGKTRK